MTELHNNKMPEILAPVGGREQLFAAVRCGADAVYMGLGDFNARKNAENFAAEDLPEVVRYCHIHSVKVYVTLNTLIFDCERESLYKTVKAVADSNADAVIVQDFSVIEAVKKICKDLPLHASTQMAVHNLSGAKELEGLGFSRVVLAREMSLDEISEVRKNTSIELEYFVHGAHCMSASGNCYLSAMLGGRSGNRGSCAQPCRLDWKTGGKSHALSLKDMSLLEHVTELKEAKVNSLKIEGRMKRPEYAAAAVTALKEALSGKEYDGERLKAVFSRSGFTDGYFTANRSEAMFGYRNKDDVTAAAPVFSELQALYRTESVAHTASMSLELCKDKPSELTFAIENGDLITVTGDIPELPRNAPLSREIAERNLSKLGGTAFKFGGLEFFNPDNLTLSAASVNALRRSAVVAAENKLCEFSRKSIAAVPSAITPYKGTLAPELRVRLASLKQYSNAFAECENITVPIKELIDNISSLPLSPDKIIAELPELIYPGNEAKYSSMLNELKSAGIIHGATGNIGGIGLLKDAGFKIHGTHGLNIANTDSLDFYKSAGLSDTVLSFELSYKSISLLGSELKRGVYGYGFLPLMLMRACPFKASGGCNSCDGKRTLTDRMGITFGTVCHNKEYTVLYNSVPLYLGNRETPAVDFFTLYFTTETPERCKEIYSLFKAKAALPGEKTNGLAFRSVF